MYIVLNYSRFKRLEKKDFIKDTLKEQDWIDGLTGNVENLLHL